MGFLSRLIGRESTKVLSGVAYDSIKLKKLTGEKGLRARLEDVVIREWPDCELRREVPAYELGAFEGAKSYSYGLYRMEQPIAMIMILNRNGNNRQDVLLSQLASVESGVCYMNFYTHLPNETDYISNRLKVNVPSI